MRFWYFTLVILLIFSVSSVSAVNYKLSYEQVGKDVLVEHVINLDEEKEIKIDISGAERDSISASSFYFIENNMMSISGKEIKVSYIDKESIEIGEKYYFVTKNRFYIDSDVRVSFILEEGFVLENQDIYPAASEIGSDGKRIIISWNKQIKEKEDLPIFVIFKDIRSSEYEWILFFALVILATIIIYFGYRKIEARKLKRVRKRKKRGGVVEHLLESEKKVMSELKGVRGGVWQKQLQIKTGFSKAKLSRTIRNLESRKLIKKIPIGNTNKIKLK